MVFVIEEQQHIAVWIGQDGHLCIKSNDHLGSGKDVTFLVNPENVGAFIDGLNDLRCEAAQ
jgi:hypothetical protein